MPDQVTQPQQGAPQPMHEARDETLRVIQSVMQGEAALPARPVAEQADNVPHAESPANSMPPRRSLIATVIKSIHVRLRRFAKRHVTPRRCAVVVLAAAIWMHPWFIPVTLFCVLLLAGLVWLFVGSDRIALMAAWVWRFYERRAPKRAAHLTERALYYREWTQARLERLPFRWAQRLYLPFWDTELEDAEADKAYAARMARLAQDG